MIEWFNLLSVISDKSRMSLVTIGIAAIIGGVMLMMRHKADLDEIANSEDDDRIRLFEQRKFRRRSLASSMLAALGILMVALYWARDPSVFIGLISLILILLLAVMFLAFLDLMSVGLQTATHDDTARSQMINEYLRQRKKLLERVEDSDSE